MTPELHTFIQEETAAINNQTVAWSDADKEKYSIPYLLKALNNVTPTIRKSHEIAEWKEKFKAVIALLNADPSKEAMRPYRKRLDAFKAYVVRKHKFVTKGHYKAIFFALGISIGTGIGISLKNLAIGLPIGIAIGFAIGAGLDLKAEKENKVL